MRAGRVLAWPARWTGPSRVPGMSASKSPLLSPSLSLLSQSLSRPSSIVSARRTYTTTTPATPATAPTHTRALVLTRTQDASTSPPLPHELLLDARRPLHRTCPKHQLLVRVDAVAINPLDTMECQGYGQRLLSLTRPLPRILGRDAVGTVVQVGANIWHMKLGDRVWISADPVSNGTFAEHIYVSTEEVSRRPPTLAPEQAVTIPFAFTTAWTALVDHIKLTPPDSPPALASSAHLSSSSSSSPTAFVHGASGPVGLMACALLRACGYRVIASIRRERSPLLALYAHDIVSTATATTATTATTTDSTTSPWHAGLHLDDSIDVFIDCVGNLDTFDDVVLRWLKPSGGASCVTFRGSLLVDTDRSGFVRGTTDAVAAYVRVKSRFTALKAARFDWVVNRPSARALAYARRMVDAGALHSIPIAQVARADATPSSSNDDANDPLSTSVYTAGIESLPHAIDDVIARRAHDGKVVIAFPPA